MGGSVIHLAAHCLTGPAVNLGINPFLPISSSFRAPEPANTRRKEAWRKQGQIVSSQSPLFLTLLSYQFAEAIQSVRKFPSLDGGAPHPLSVHLHFWPVKYLLARPLIIGITRPTWRLRLR